ncbi:hypothetical protein CNEO3_810001 [Clostridium neonatale]|uniref:hypothetical protein n=1 Tax=Clostridium neonatale TaxID=137838 RepID=UPI00291C023F|nr:hypothetical protein CNEO3_790029 [Clostridium neonatale]CAI3711970.1 hypothetical protein CNEO3_750001 [Clostridium neonatale]CAI3718363.1 hypothetical protein CNEO3_840029 [Clostridium neonatale]CAI3719767.1 hypothetical protein CNEO3_780029 [Clostridium neonatale]CAI3721303.1 hypothetical protein CNEO3_810001 [Clostridium neonatale]
MKIKRTFFERNIEGKYKLVKINENIFIHIRKPKSVIASIGEFLLKILQLPIAYILAILSAIYDCTIDLPQYIRLIIESFISISPIEYIKVIEDKNIDEIK